jgi:hypothetical protein
MGRSDSDKLLGREHHRRDRQHRRAHGSDVHLQGLEVAAWHQSWSPLDAMMNGNHFDVFRSSPRAPVRMYSPIFA